MRYNELQQSVTEQGGEGAEPPTPPKLLAQGWPSRAESRSSASRLGDSAKMSASRLGDSGDSALTRAVTQLQSARK
jgi:hypothetical protein